LSSSRSLPREVVEPAAAAARGDLPAATDDLAAIQRGKVVEVLPREGGKKSNAARALGIDRRKVQRATYKAVAIEQPKPCENQGSGRYKTNGVRRKRKLRLHFC